MERLERWAHWMLAVCILIPGVTAHLGLWSIWDWCFYDSAVSIGGVFVSIRGLVMVAAGLAAGLLWFRLRGQKAGRTPKGVPVLLALATLGVQ